MTTTFEATWRCGSAENRRGATIVVLPDDGATAAAVRAIAGVLPTEAAVVALRGLPRRLADALAAIESWLDREAGDVEELWLVGIGGGAIVATALALRTPERYAGAALLRVRSSLAPLVGPSGAARRAGVDLDVLPGGLPVEEQRDLAVWFAGRFARGPRLHRSSTTPSDRSPR